MPKHKKSEIKELSDSLEETLIDKNFESAMIELSELTIDSMLDEGIVKDIPVINILIGIAKTAFNVRERLFLHKIVSFINGLNDTSLEQRQKTISEINNSRKYRIKVGQKLLYIIDKTQDHESSEVLAILFAEVIKGTLKYEKFLKTALVLERVTSSELRCFVNAKNDDLKTIEGTEDFMFSGLLGTYLDPFSVRDGMDRAEDKYEVEGGKESAYITEVGDILRSVLKGKF
jgi:hypothetical protein